MTIRERIAKVLGWSIEDTRSFSLAALRDFVRPKDMQLAEDISGIIQRGEHITKEVE